MKGELDENGVLTLIPHSPIEAFALNQWLGLMKQLNGGKIDTAHLVVKPYSPRLSTGDT
jgi:hypothetical protein